MLANFIASRAVPENEIKSNKEMLEWRVKSLEILLAFSFYTKINIFQGRAEITSHIKSPLHWCSWLDASFSIVHTCSLLSLKPEMDFCSTQSRIRAEFLTLYPERDFLKSRFQLGIFASEQFLLWKVIFAKQILYSYVTWKYNSLYYHPPHKIYHII